MNTCVNGYNNFMCWVEKSAEKFAQLPDRKPHQEPWVTTAPAYLLNPLVNVAFTAIHIGKTLENTVKACYYLGTSILSSLATIATLGTKKEINQACVKQWVGLGLNLYATILSLGFTLANIGAGVQGLLAIKEATKNEAWLIKQQNGLSKELSKERPTAHEQFYEWAFGNPD